MDHDETTCAAVLAHRVMLAHLLRAVREMQHRAERSPLVIDTTMATLENSVRAALVRLPLDQAFRLDALAQQELDRIFMARDAHEVEA